MNRARKYSLAGALLILLASGAITAASLAGWLGRWSDDPHAWFVCNEPVFDFGQLSAADTPLLSHTFRLNNKGSASIKIRRILNSCGCTTTSPDKTVIPPGSTALLHAKIDWRGRNGAQASTITILTDESEPVILRLKGRVTAPVVLWPSELDFGDLEPGLSAEKTIKILPGADRDPFKILEIQTTDPAVQIRRLPSVSAESPNGPGVYGIQVLAPRNSGQMSAKVLFRVSTDEGQFYARITAHYRGAMIASPPSLLFMPDHQHPTHQSISIQVPHPLTHDPISYRLISSTQPAIFRVGLVTVADEDQCRSASISVDSDVPASGYATAILSLQCGEDHLEVPLVAIAKSHASDN